MSALLTRLTIGLTRARLSSMGVLNTARPLSSTSSNSSSSTPRYPHVDEQADDRERFKNDSFYNKVVLIGTPTIIGILIYMATLGHHLEKPFDQSKYVEYPYLNVRNTPFPWSDGNHTLFHNPRHLFVPGVGFEKPLEPSDKHH